jgi:hypothetical protein
MRCLRRHKKVISRRWFFVFASIIRLAHVGCTEVFSLEEAGRTISMNLPVKNKKNQ